MFLMMSTKSMFHLRVKDVHKMIQDDATYKLNYFDFPVFICSSSKMTGRFFMTHMALSSREDTSSLVRIYAYVTSVIGGCPRYLFIFC